jgi:hypothetical protein
LPLADQPLAAGQVQRQQTAGRQQGALGPVVDVSHFVPVFLEADPANEIVLDDLIDNLPLGPLVAGRSLLGFTQQWLAQHDGLRSLV